MEYIMLKMGEIIRDMRKARGLTQDALAQAVGVSVQAVSKWETAQSLPDVALLPAIADFFETTVDALFGREAEKERDDNKEEAVGASVDFPDDDVFRVVQYMGRRLMSAQECADGKAIRLALDQYEGALNVEVQGDARIDGSVSGNLRAAGDAYVSGNMNGAATAGGDIYCEGRVTVIHDGGAARGEAAGDIEINVRDAVKKGLSGLGSVLSEAFSFGASSGSRRMEPFFKDELPEDEVLRVVQLQGRKILRVEESAGEKVIRLAVDHLEGPLHVEVYGGAAIQGDVGGDVKAGDGLACGNVGGNAIAGDAMQCGDVGGDAKAGDGLTCGSVGGNAFAGDGMQCGNVGGDVRAGDSVRVSGDVGGNVSAGENVTCQSVSGVVIRGTVRGAR